MTRLGSSSMSKRTHSVSVYEGETIPANSLVCRADGEGASMARGLA